MMLLRVCFFAMILCLSHVGFAQTGLISGKVVDKDGALPFVNVSVKNTSWGAVTDEDGLFKISGVPYGEHEVVISLLGFGVKTQVVVLSSANPQAFLNIELSAADELLDEIVVSVPGGRLQEDLVVNVEQQVLDDIYVGSSHTLAESISNLSGVSQNSTGTSIGKPVIRGLTSNRVVTYAQGTRIENQQWGAEHGLGVSSNGIKSVEVIKGPASLLYGSDAIGGVLYFVDEGFTSNGTEGVLESSFFSNSLTTQNRVGLKTDLGILKLNIFGGFNSAADYSVPESGQTETQRLAGQRVFNTRFNEKSAKVALGVVREKSISKLTYSYLNNFFGIPSDVPFVENAERDFVLPFQDVTQHNLAFENHFSLGTAEVDLTLGYAVNDRQEFNEVAESPDLHLNLDVYSYNLKISNLVKNKQFNLILGTQGLHQINENLGTTFLIPDGQSTEYGIYSLFNYDVSDQLGFQTGLRFDSKNIQAESVLIDGVLNFSDFNNTYNTLNYSLGSKYELGDFTLRFNVASGFRAPNTSELLSNGEHGGVGRIEVGDLDLVSEVATQFDFALNYEGDNFSFILNPFYNNINNYIFIAPTNEVGDGNLPIFAYLQEDARLYGGEFSFAYRPEGLSKLSFQGNAALTFGDDSQGAPLPLITPINFNSRISYAVNLGGKLRFKSAYLQMQNYLAQNRVSEFELPNEAYNLVNVGFEASYGRFGFNFAVKNLFNTSYVDHLSRLKTIFEDFTVANPGRDFTFGLRVDF